MEKQRSVEQYSISPFENKSGLNTYRSKIKKNIKIASLIGGFYLICIIGFVAMIPLINLLPESIYSLFYVFTGILFLLVGYIVADFIINIIGSNFGMKGLRRYFKEPNYQPLKPEVIEELNNIIETESGKLFRKYQYINVDKSCEDKIIIETPISSNEFKMNGCHLHDKICLVEKACMFGQLSEEAICDILTPISEYHRQKVERKKIEKEEKYVEEKSEINANITNEDLNDLPLIRSFRKVEVDIQSDIDKYKEEQENHFEKYVSILKEAGLGKNKS